MILLGGYLIFDSDPGFVSICGAFAALCGMSVYTSYNLQESRESLTKQLPKHNLPPPSRPNPNTEETSELDEKDTPNVV